MRRGLQGRRGAVVAALALAAAACLCDVRGAAGAAGPSDADAWASVQNSNDVDALRDFILKHRGSHFAGEARTRIAQLEAAAPMPPPTTYPARALASILRFDDVAQMGAALTPTPLSIALTSAPTQAPVAPAQAIRNPPPAEPAQAQPQPQPQPPPLTPAAEPPVRLALAPTPMAAGEQGALLARPRMIEFDMPTLPNAFCSQVDMYSYLSVFHTALDRAAKANNQTAIAHLKTLSDRFTALIGAQPGSAEFLAVDTELHAYQLEADSRFKTAEEVNALDPKIRRVPIKSADGCAREPWPSPVRSASAAPG